MASRTGRASQRMVLRELLGEALKRSNKVPNFIDRLEKSGVNLILNQASTGRVSGISYCYGGFVAKGQALGNQFKWGQVSKILHYEQTKDFQPIDQANRRTRAAYPQGGNDFKAGKPTADRMPDGTPRQSETYQEEPKKPSGSNSFQPSNARHETGSKDRETDFGIGREPENLQANDHSGTNSVFHADSAIAGLGELLAGASGTGSVNDDGKKKKKKKGKEEDLGLGR